ICRAVDCVRRSDPVWPTPCSPRCAKKGFGLWPKQGKVSGGPRTLADDDRVTGHDQPVSTTQCHCRDRRTQSLLIASARIAASCGGLVRPHVDQVPRATVDDTAHGGDTLVSLSGWGRPIVCRASGQRQPFTTSARSDHPGPAWLRLV